MSENTLLRPKTSFLAHVRATKRVFYDISLYEAYKKGICIVSRVHFIKSHKTPFLKHLDELVKGFQHLDSLAERFSFGILCAETIE